MCQDCTEFNCDYGEICCSGSESGGEAGSNPRQFVMEIEPHTPSNPERPCSECVLQSGPMCLDRSYCEFRETGKTWRMVKAI